MFWRILGRRETVKRFCIENHHRDTGDAESLPYASGSFDLVVSAWSENNLDDDDGTHVEAEYLEVVARAVPYSQTH